MKNALMLAILTIALCGCADSHKEEEHEHAHLHNFTAYTAGHEFFMQHEGIAVNSTACVTLYVSRLSDFKPTAASVATATLKVGDGVQNFTASASEPGIFNFKITPAAAGEGELTFEVDGEKAHFHIDVPAEGEAHDHSHGHAHGGDGHAGHEGHSHAAEEHVHAHGEHSHEGHSHAAEEHVHAHGEHSHEGHSHAAGEHVHAHGEHSHEGHGHDAGACGHGHNHDGHSHDNHNHAGHDHAAHAGHGAQTEGKPGDIAFGKEQSWKIDFATAVVAETHFGGAVKVAAKVVPAADNFTTIVASTNGKVQFVGNVVEGKDVEEGEALFYLEGGDVTDNDAAVKFAEAESNYLVAKADYERKKTLWNEKVVSERDYQAAEAAYRQAEARYASMKRSFTGSKVTLKALRGGYVATLHVANGDYVEPGTPLATIHSGGVANIVAELPMRYAAQLSTIKDVNIELPSGSAFSMNGHGGSVVAVGKSANACNMLPLTVSAGDIKGLVPGSIVTLYIISESGEPVVTVPRTALVEEMGNLFVFVQNNPVSFEKREVVAGAGDGINVQILKGLHAGERVVTKGAVSLKLSQGADAVDPHAGHVH